MVEEYAGQIILLNTLEICTPSSSSCLGHAINCVSFIAMFTWGSLTLRAVVNVLSPKFNSYSYINICGPGSSVGIATDYGLDGPGSNPGGDEIFRPARPALGPAQPPVKWVPGLSWG